MRIIASPIDNQVQSLQEPSRGTLLDTTQAQDLAILAAYQGAGHVFRNPLVGVVAVDHEHRFIALASHLYYGGEHAEQALVRRLQEEGRLNELKGATLYVTLEPCSHEGKTPSCARLLESCELAQVICGEQDPNPLVDGKGFEILRAKGIKCRIDPSFAERCRPLTRRFIHGLRLSRPYIGLKSATFLNHISAYSGDQRTWITGERARAYGHWLRVLYDGILVGANTVILDNPRLDARMSLVAPDLSPWRIIIDPHARALFSRPVTEQQCLQHAPHKVLWACTKEAWDKVFKQKQALEQLGAHAILWRPDLDLEAWLTTLTSFSLSSVLIEGGAKTWNAFMEAGCVDEMHMFAAPRWSQNDQTAQALQAPPFKILDPTLSPLGEDWVIEGAIAF
jgi:diaminohydroxyphosphoribosylaminopyrimidine deaminase/5-amino-6-(5-phosphoribosylamino)uracil reductase